MRSTFKILFYLKKNAPKRDGSVPIMGRITINGTIAQFSVKMGINPVLWDIKTGRAGGRGQEAQRINWMLDRIRMSIYKHYFEIREKEEYVSAQVVKDAFLGLSKQQETLLKLFSMHNEEFAKKVGKGRALGTYKKYCQVYNHLIRFLKVKLRKNDIRLQELNYQFIQDFDLYLRSEARCNANTVWVYTMPLKKMIAIARNNGCLNHNPFMGYRAVPQTTARGYLSYEEIGCLLQGNFIKSHYGLVRDLFLFSCFTGLSYTDIRNLTYENLRISFDGHWWIMTHRQKTKMASNIRLLEIPKKIIEKYSKPEGYGRIFHMPANTTCNYILKRVAELCQIKTYLTFHVARHTFATTITLSQGVPIETVSSMLGHANIKTTQIYAHITNQKISQDMEILSGRLKKIKGLII